MGAPKDTEVFIFIESLKVAEEFQAVGIGKWMMGVMMRHLLGHITICGLDSDRIVVGVIPFPVDSDDDGFAEKEERLRDWYKHVFKCLETTESFSATKNFEYKDDKESETSSRVVYWSAGGKKKGKR